MRKTLTILACMFLYPSTMVFAQETPETLSVAPSGVDITPEIDAQGTPGIGDIELIEEEVDVRPYDIPSIVFTFWEHTAIKDARRSRGLVRAPTEAELMKDLRQQGEEELERVRPPPEKREIRLGGILYTSAKDWTIWLNEQRVTPKAIPKEIIDIFVYDEYIEIKWFDDWSNQIFPIRLRTHQRFNMDTRIFLPG